ncbi:MAG: hypothetical protein ABEJ93_01695 [Candidatus Nanohalobium sp.]
MAPTPPSLAAVFQSGEQMGLFSGILPFIITYTIFFFLIRHINLLDDNNDTFAAILSIAFAFYTSKFMIAHPVYQDFLMQYVSRIALITVGILGLLVTLAFVGLDLSSDDNKKYLGYVMVLITLVAFGVSGGLPVIAGTGTYSQVMALVSWLIESGTIWILAVIGLLGWTLKDDSDDDSSGGLPDLFEALSSSSGNE